MGQRSRKRGKRTRSPVSRSELRNEAVRATLTPLEPGERPWPIAAGAVIAALLGLGTLIAYLAGARTKLGGKPPSVGEVVVYAGVMLVCAGGMWQLRYWAVLGFQTLLAIALLGFALALIRASTVIGAAICVVVLVGGGYLFYKLVRSLSRIQMPKYPGR